MAGRLAAADPNLSILVIEGGQDNYDNPSVVHPALFLENLAPTSKTAIFYPTTTQPQLAGRSPVVAAGGVLGGGSSINFAMYTRAQREDYDAWDTPGWSTTELLPYFKKVGLTGRYYNIFPVKANQMTARNLSRLRQPSSPWL